MDRLTPEGPRSGRSRWRGLARWTRLILTFWPGAFVTLFPRDFNRQLCRALGVEATATPVAVFDALQRQITQLHREHRLHPVIILDEAHLMSDGTLAHLRVWANFRWDSEPLMSLIHGGLPELHERLRLGIHRSLLTRLSTRISL